MASPTGAGGAQQEPLQFGGAYAGLGPRRQHLIDDWVTRLNAVSGLQVEPAAFYDTYVKFSTKTTFDAVTHALMTTPLTDASGASLGDGLDLIETVDTVRGQVPGASGDRQFRVYVLLKQGSPDLLERSQQFKRVHDNTVYHKGYPINYRGQGGTPSIQISMALDRRHADIDVDYRSSSLPASIFNGHLSAANSDVRVGNNFDRHSVRWTGLQSWWRSFLGVNLGSKPIDETPQTAPFVIPPQPRVGAQPIDVMVGDFLKSWLVEGNVAASMSYVSERAVSCLAEDADDPATFDRGMAPFQLMTRLKAAHEALGPHDSLEGLTFGVRLTTPGLRTMTQPNHAQYVVYSVPDDVAARFDCARDVSPAGAARATRRYGNYYGSVFYVAGSKGNTVALLWAKEKSYWKIVSWRTDAEAEADRTPEPEAVATPSIVRIPADATLVQAATSFLENWLVRKDYDRAFAYLSPESYACYNPYRNPGAPPAASDADAARLIRAGLEAVGAQAGKVSRLNTIVTAADPTHPAIRLMQHASSRTFSLLSYADSVGRLASCTAPAGGPRYDPDAPQTYGSVFGMNIRFLTGAGEGPVLRTLWQKQSGQWQITTYDIEYP
jgi:hypothetical protein